MSGVNGVFGIKCLRYTRDIKFHFSSGRALFYITRALWISPREKTRTGNLSRVAGRAVAYSNEQKNYFVSLYIAWCFAGNKGTRLSAGVIIITIPHFATYRRLLSRVPIEYRPRSRYLRRPCEFIIVHTTIFSQFPRKARESRAARYAEEGGWLNLTHLYRMCQKTVHLSLLI